MLKYVLALILLGHGLAHLSGFIASWTKSSAGYEDRSWIFSSGIRLNSSIGKIFGLVWLAAMVFLVSSGIGLLTNQGWWIQTAVAGAILSLAAIIPWWKAVPPGAKFGAAFDGLLLMTLLTPIREFFVY